MQTAFAQDVRCHRRCSRFAVHSCDENCALVSHDSGKRFSASHDRFSKIARAYQDGIVALDGGGENHELCLACMFSLMLFVKTQPKPLQSFRLQGANFVRTADRVPELK